MTKVYVFENSFYIGDNLSEKLKEKADLQEVEIPDEKEIKVTNGVVEFVDMQDTLENL